MSLLRLQQVERRYPDGGNGERVALRAMDLCIEAGERVLITGPSGSGKSTLLSILGGWERASAGRTWWKDEESTHWKAAQWDRWRLAHVGILFQDIHLVPAWNLWENAVAPSVLPGAPPLDLTHLQELVETLGLARLVKRRVDTLSRGEQQRAALVRALALKPALLLADEPTASLDAKGEARVWDLLWSLSAILRFTLIASTHHGPTNHRVDRRLELEHGCLREVA